MVEAGSINTNNTCNKMKKVTEIGVLNETILLEHNSNKMAAMILENKDIDEGFVSTLLGGTAGFLIGPMIGRAIAKVLGVERGILFDLLTSKMVGTALGSALANATTTPVKQVVPAPVKK